MSDVDTNEPLPPNVVDPEITLHYITTGGDGSVRTNPSPPPPPIACQMLQPTPASWMYSRFLQCVAPPTSSPESQSTQIVTGFLNSVCFLEGQSN